MAKQSSALRLGDRVGKANVRQGAPPVVFAVQPDSYVVVDSPEALKQWEADARKFLGINASGLAVGSATESCSAGCSDDCDVL